MSFLRKQLEASPAHARVIPFATFLVLTFAPEWFGGLSPYWFYVAKTVVGAWMIFEMRSLVPEMKWAVSVEAILVGVAVFVMWVGIDPWYSKIGSGGFVWHPHSDFPSAPVVAWGVIIARILGSTLVVPPLEEVFYRSFLYRYFVRTDFREMPFSKFHFTSFLVTSMLFGFEHSQWLAGILCGFAYQWLVLRKNRLGDAMTAHAITNFLLGIWVVWKGDWQFW